MLCCLSEVLLITIQFLIQCLLSRPICIFILVMPFTVLEYMLLGLIFLTTWTNSSQYHLWLFMHVCVQSVVSCSQSCQYYLL